MHKIWSIHWNFREFSANGQESEIMVMQISCSSPELWAKRTKSGGFAGISTSSLPMVRHLKALMYSGSVNGVNCASIMGFWGELRKICIIRWRFCQKTKLNLKNFACKFKKTKKQMCMVKRTIFLAKRFGLFAVRLPSLSQGKWTVGLWHNFWYFYPCFTQVIIFFDFINSRFTKKT